MRDFKDIMADCYYFTTAISIREFSYSANGPAAAAHHHMLWLRWKVCDIEV